MQDFTRENIIAHRFASSRRKGYDTLEVDAYLERVAEYVGSLQSELAQHRATERTALDLLHHAQRVADETVAAAERDAAKLQRNAKDGLENARKDARAMLDAARADADRTLLYARVEADAAIEDSKRRIAELEAAAAERSRELEGVVEQMRMSAMGSVSDLRAAGSRLLGIADHLEFEVAHRHEPVDAPVDVDDVGSLESVGALERGLDVT